MKIYTSRLILVAVDMVSIALSTTFAFYTRAFFDSWFAMPLNRELGHFLNQPFLYLIIFIILFYEGIYTKRFDFWQESRELMRALVLAFMFIFTLLAFTKSAELFSRPIIAFTFIYLLLVMPLLKNFTKKLLFRVGLWRTKAKLYGDDEFLKKELFGNPYLGYVHSQDEELETIFINSQKLSSEKLKEIIKREIHTNREVIFIPIVNDYNMTQSTIFELSVARTNLIVFKNRLKSRYRLYMQHIFNYFLVIVLLPFILFIMLIVAILIKRESKGPIIFAHNRVGKNGRIIPTYKFRSMYSDAQERLEKLISEDAAIKEEWESTFKLKDDPRITKVGSFLRKTSLDELPQIFNVFKGEMNFVGPRPVIQEELDLYYKEDTEYYNMVKPGITGLWQVSGRSDVDYVERVAIDVWYVRNWSIWLDMVILLRTLKVVLFRKGAY